jgi:hypothetical protein
MKLDDLIPQVILEAPAVADIAASYQIALAARELCTFSLAWQDEVTLPLSGRSLYDFAPDEGDLVEPMSGVYAPSATGSTSVIRPATPAQLDLNDPSWRTRTGNPLWYYFPSSDSVRFVPNPPTGNVIIRVALQPNMGQKTIDDRVGSVFNEGVVHGALYRLLRMPDREWTNYKLASYYGDLFEQAKSTAQVRGVDNFAKVARKVRYGGL